MGEVKSLLDILELQRQLDETISKKRDSGFVPRERQGKDIVLSIVAEIIEFNEKTPDTHKTWKEKDFSIDKMKEEAVDILFFLAQLILYDEKATEFFNKEYNLPVDDSSIKEYNDIWEDSWEKKEYTRRTTLYPDLFLLGEVTRFGDTPYKKIITALQGLVMLYQKYNITKEEVYDIYYKKWQKNIGRIKGDWTK